MNAIELNGEKMISKELAHIYLAELLDLSDDYKNNLDDLWNQIMLIAEPTTVHITNTEELLDNLGDYGDALLQVFEDASSENAELEIIID